MATADELLASYSNVGNVVTIDNNLRTINIPPSIRNLGVESDAEVRRVYFQMPGEYYGVDLSKFNIRINYLNGANEDDVYDVHDAVSQSDGTIMFSWLIGRHAASVMGNVTFNVCLKETNIDGHVLREFNTTPATLPILKGLECDPRVIQEHVDILEQWHARLFGIGDTEEARILAVSQEQQQVIRDKSESILSDIERKGSETLSTIPADYAETYRMAEEAVRTKADAIVLEAEGATITVNDGSDNVLQNLKAYGNTTQTKTTGKNLFNIMGIESTGAITNNDGSLTVDIPATSSAVSTYRTLGELAPLLEVGTTYYFTFNTTGSTRFIYLDAANITWTSGMAMVITQVMLDSTVFLYGSGVSTRAVISDMMIWSGSGTSNAYEPYSGGMASPNPEYPQDLVSVENPTVHIYGKNLFSSAFEEYTLPKDYYVCPVYLETGSTYTLSCSLKPGKTGMSGATVGIARYGDDYAEFKSAMHAVLWNDGELGKVSFIVTENWTDPKLIVYTQGGKEAFDSIFNTYNIQLELGPNVTEYEPYKFIRPLTLTRSLRGIPVTSGGTYTDEKGQQWISDEVDLARGVHIQRIKVVTLSGSIHEGWTAYDNNAEQGISFVYWPTDGLNFFYSSLCDKYRNVEGSWGVPYFGKCGIYSDHTTGTGRYFRPPNSSVTSVDLWKSWLSENPITFMYILKIPVETPLTSDEIMAYRCLNTNRANTIVANNCKAHMVIAYSADTLTFLRDNQPVPTDEQVEKAVKSYLDERIDSLIKAYLDTTNNT